MHTQYIQYTHSTYTHKHTNALIHTGQYTNTHNIPTYTCTHNTYNTHTAHTRHIQHTHAHKYIQYIHSTYTQTHTHTHTHIQDTKQPQYTA